MKREIFYLMSGPAHLPYLVVSLWTLKNHWRGDVIVHAWPESFNLLSIIAADKRLRVSKIYCREPEYRGKNSQFLDKMKVAQQSRADVALYLDADTTIHGSLNPLFEMAEDRGFTATQFCDWMTGGKIIRSRVRGLEAFGKIDKTLIDRATQERWPSVNGGVWATPPNSPVLPAWYEWTLAAKKTFIADEKVLHLMMLRFCPDQMTVMCENGKYNCSPMYQSSKLTDEDVVIRHYHGDCNVRPGKSWKGHDLWMPLFKKCLIEDVGGMDRWIDNVKNKFLRRLRK